MITVTPLTFFMFCMTSMFVGWFSAATFYTITPCVASMVVCAAGVIGTALSIEAGQVQRRQRL